MNRLLIFLNFSIVFFVFQSKAQVCGTPGLQGFSINTTQVLNTYYTPDNNIILNPGSNSFSLLGVPSIDPFGISYGNSPIATGDLLLIIQMQDAVINTSNSNLYGNNNSFSAPDRLGGTGIISSSSAGIYEYIVAKNDVPITGGTLQFKGGGPVNGLVNTFRNVDGDGISRGKSTFQVIRIPQYSNLTLGADVTAPVFNGNVGGIVALDVAGVFNLNGFKIDVSGKGFRGGFLPKLSSLCNSSTNYTNVDVNSGGGKGEGIAGTPIYVWNGKTFVDNGLGWTGFPGGSFGKGAPGNAGGGGNDYNAGGGGGANAGFGGVGGNGFALKGACINDPGEPNGGRPGSNILPFSPKKLFMGGGGGSGDSDDDILGNYGGNGGGIIIINAGRVLGNGKIEANGLNGKSSGFYNFSTNWNGQTITDTGYHTINLHTVSGVCDSFVTRHFILSPKRHSYTYYTACASNLPYIWNNMPYSTPGNYTITLNSVDGCDSIATLIFSISNFVSINDNIRICSNQLPFYWHNNQYNTTNTYNIRLPNSNGCDTIATLNLIVGAINRDTITQTICTAQLPYTWNTITGITTSGTYRDSLKNSFGCDSIVVLNLVVANQINSTTNLTICSAQLPFNWNGLVFNAAGPQTAHLTTVAGCDSLAKLILSVLPVITKTDRVKVCGNQLPYTWYGISYYRGTHSITILGQSGCDTLATLILDSIPLKTSLTTASICENLIPYVWNGNVYNASGVYTFITLGSNNCDSIATLNLTIKPISRDTIEHTICRNELPYSWHGISCIDQGYYSYTTPNGSANRCDSVTTLHLIVKDLARSDISVTICSGFLPYLWHGNSYNSPGDYSDTIRNGAINGCDSVVFLHLIVPVASSSFDTTICVNSLPFTWIGGSCTTDGSYNYTYTRSNGCDSIVTLNLHTTNILYGTVYDTLCFGDSIIWNGTKYYLPGNYTYFLPLGSIGGCDTITTLNLFVKPLKTSIKYDTICQNLLPYVWRGKTYTISGLYSDTLHAAGSNGCDSILLLNLTVHPSDSTNFYINVYSCDLPYRWPLNGVSYNTSGTYYHTVKNRFNCDSVVKLQLDVHQILVCQELHISIDWTHYNWLLANCIRVSPNVFQCPHLGINGAGDTLFTIICETIQPDIVTNLSYVACSNQLPYIWNGIPLYRDTSITVVYNLSSWRDSTVNFNFTVNQVSTSDQFVTICSNATPFLWNGQQYSISGNYSTLLTNAQGCNYTANLHLTVNPTRTSTTNDTICSSLLPYQWNGLSCSAAGTYTVHLLTQNGCDSSCILKLTVKNVAVKTINLQICDNQIPYAWNGQTLSASGTYTYINTSGAANGCDSITNLNLTVTSTIVTTENKTLCYLQLPTFTWNGLGPFTQPGTYQKTLTSSAGCDSIVTLNLDTVHTYRSTTYITLCASEVPIAWNGSLYSNSGTYSKKLVGTGGCDSIATLNLLVNDTSIINVPLTLCSNQLPYYWYNQVINSSGIYTQLFSKTNGCDSTVHLIVRVNSTSTSVTNLSVCVRNLPYTWNGISCPIAGTYNKILNNSLQCDSIAVLNLSINPASSSITAITVCKNNIPYTWNGQRYYNPGTYSITLTNSNGCDSIANLFLSIRQIDTSVAIATVCSNQLPYVWNGNRYYFSGIFRQSFTSSFGCDSIAKLILTVYDASSSIDTITICSGAFPFVWNGQSFSTPGLHSVTLTNYNGCDSIAKLFISTTSAFYDTTDIVACADVLPDGSGGGGAGGSVYINCYYNSTNANIDISANGGDGGNTNFDLSGEHGPGGGGGGGIIWHKAVGASLVNKVDPGKNGLTNSGNSGAIAHGATSGKIGYVGPINTNLPSYLQVQGASCLPILKVNKSELHPGVPGSRTAGNNASYTIKVSNMLNNGAANGVIITDQLPSGFEFVSAIVAYTGSAMGLTPGFGPMPITNTGTISNPKFESFYIPPGDTVIIKMIAHINNNVQPGIYHNGAQASYLDPTRINNVRLISPQLYAIAGQNTDYESGYLAGVSVPGQNYDGTVNGPHAEDVHVIAPGSIPNFIVCEKGKLSLTVTPPALSAPFTYSWTGPSFVNPSTIASPEINQAQLSDAGIYYVTITDGNGFTSSYQTTVTVNPSPVASYSNTNPLTQCLTNNLISLSSSSIVNNDAITSTAWNFDDNSPSISQTSANHTYLQEGIYDVKLLVETSHGCKDSIYIPVVIHANPSSNIISNGPLATCFGNSVNLISNSQPGSGSITNYQWLLNGNQISGAISNTLSIQDPGSYQLEVTNSNTCSTRSIAQIVTIYPLPIGAIQNANTGIICDGYNTPLSVTASSGSTYQWYVANPSNSNVPTLITGANGPTYNASQPGQYTVELTNPQGCKKFASGNVLLNLLKKPIVDFTMPSICAGSLVHFNNFSIVSSSGPVTYNWNFGDLSQESHDVNPAHIYASGATYPVELTVTPSDCPNLTTTAVKNIYVEEPIKGIRYPIINTVKNTNTELHARDFASQYLWRPSIGISNPNQKNPIFNYNQNIEYTIELTTALGCKTVDTQYVQVQPAIDIKVPTAFTPNGDGHNDLLDVFLIDIVEFRFFRVFNRWGQLLFETTDPKQKWDGTFKGKKQPAETYVWIAQGVGKNNQIINRRGECILIR